MYLDDEDVEGLKRLAETTGRSQSELIREGIRRILTFDYRAVRNVTPLQGGSFMLLPADASADA